MTSSEATAPTTLCCYAFTPADYCSFTLFFHLVSELFLILSSDKLFSINDCIYRVAHWCLGPQFVDGFWERFLHGWSIWGKDFERNEGPHLCPVQKTDKGSLREFDVGVPNLSRRQTEIMCCLTIPKLRCGGACRSSHAGSCFQFFLTVPRTRYLIYMSSRRGNQNEQVKLNYYEKAFEFESEVMNFKAKLQWQNIAAREYNSCARIGSRRSSFYVCLATWTKDRGPWGYQGLPPLIKTVSTVQSQFCCQPIGQKPTLRNSVT